MDMKVKDLIKKLEEFDQEAKVVTITVGKNNNWGYTSTPQFSVIENMFGKSVFIV